MACGQTTQSSSQTAKDDNMKLQWKYEEYEMSLEGGLSTPNVSNKVKGGTEGPDLGFPNSLKPPEKEEK